MTLTDYIQIEGGFLSAVNIAFDLNNDKKIKSFIPTFGSLELLKDLLLSTHDKSTDRARILIGAYGKGKSQIILVLLALVYRKEPALFENLLQALKDFEPELYDYVLDYMNGDKKLLPIVIQGSHTSLNQSFLSALQKSLEFAELADLMPDTHFQAALNVINRWESEYQNTYLKFINSIDCPLDEFTMALGDFDVNAYEKFEKIYPTLTSGSQFNPFLGFDVVELYSDVVDALCKRGYAGIYVVYDEFSKYLESSITKASITDIKMLQDFAEKCNRSKEKQMHLLLVSHKDITNYIDKLPLQKVDGWKGVSERFKHVELLNHFSQIYEIISNVIKKTVSFKTEFLPAHSNEFEELINNYQVGELFSELETDHLQSVISGCYPLQPVTTFILPRLSELIAQNERTLFTFLSSNHKNTLSEFLRNEQGSFPLLTPDKLYDYFEPLLKKEPYTSEIRKVYNTAASILTQLDLDNLEAKLVKTIALIEIVNQPVKLPPVADVITKLYGNSVAEAQKVGSALADLKDKKFVVYVSRKTTHLKLKSPIGSDIRKKILDLAEKNKHLYDVKAILAEVSMDQYLYPTSYNDDMEIVRYFDFSFINGNEFLAVDDWSKKIFDLKADGIVFGIIPENSEIIATIETKILKQGEIEPRVLFVLPKEYKVINDTAYEYNAVKTIKATAKDDEAFVFECNLYEDDLVEALNAFVMGYTKPELREAHYYYQGEKKTFYRKAQLSQQLSNICQEIYYKTPIIKNEILNNHELTSVANRSRNRVVKGLLATKLEPMLGLSGSGQEVSFMRSALIVTEILENYSLIPKLKLHNLPDENLQNIINEINQFFLESGNSKGISFGKLYQKLTKPEHHIGLKRGVIPIYIACVLNQYKEHLVILSNDSEVEITADLLNSINENPTDYVAYLEEWNADKTEYINQLESLFAEFITESEKEFNSFAYITRGMQRWFMSLPKYARELKSIYLGNDTFENLDKADKKLIQSLMKPSLNSREYLFDKLFSIYGLDGFSLTVINHLEKSKGIFDQAKAHLIKKLMADLGTLFKTEDVQNFNTTYSSIIKDWLDTLKVTTKTHSFTGSNGSVFQVIQSITNDQVTFMERLSKAAVGLRIDDWNETTIQNFLTVLEAFKNTVEQYDQETVESSQAGGNENYILTVRNDNGEESIKRFSRIEASSRAKILKNEISTAIEDMGQAITEEEKRQILLEILETMI